jgi:hypothetical protein
LAPGTYWFTLQDASVPSGDPVYWDQNDGPSTAYENVTGNLAGNNNGCNTCSEAFQIYGANGPSSSTPEPATLSLLGTGLLFLLGIGRRRIA